MLRFSFQSHISYEEFVRVYGNFVQISDAEKREAKLKELYDANVPKDDKKFKSKRISD